MRTNRKNIATAAFAAPTLVESLRYWLTATASPAIQTAVPTEAKIWIASVSRTHVLGELTQLTKMIRRPVRSTMRAAVAFITIPKVCQLFPTRTKVRLRLGGGQFMKMRTRLQRSKSSPLNILEKRINSDRNLFWGYTRLDGAPTTSKIERLTRDNLDPRRLSRSCNQNCSPRTTLVSART